MNTNIGRWFIWLAEPQREMTGAAGLVARRFDAFSPSVYKAVAMRDHDGRHLKDEHGKKRWKKISEPMFRGYGLIRFADDGNEGFYAATKVPGVRGFLRAPGATTDRHRYATLPTVLVDAIRSEEEFQLSAYETAQRTGSDKLKIPFVENGPARIEGGPYDDWIGKMLKLSKSGRIRMLVAAFGGNVEIEIDASQVRAA